MKESDIRPQAIFEEYLRLTEADIKTFFGVCQRKEISCPACGGKGVSAFDKSGFSYVECAECLTLYVNPRPVRSAFDDYYSDSPSTKYWATTFYRETEQARRELIWKPKAVLIRDKIQQFAKVTEILDIGGGYGTFAEEISCLTEFNVEIVEPSKHLAEVCRSKGFSVIEKFLEDIEGDPLGQATRCMVSFELFEHLHAPFEFLKTLRNLMKQDDLFIFSTLNGAGLDIRVLWENSRAVSPPHHLNFFTPASIEMLLVRSGFETLEITTPGKLDIDIIENNLSYVKDRFWPTYFEFATEQDKKDLQDYFASRRMSSHMMVVCRRTHD